LKTLLAYLFADAIYDGIYRDDGSVVFKGNWSKSKITDWLENFQEEVNRVTRYHGLQFTILASGEWRGKTAPPTRK
jgi:hypothetical protein